MFLDSPAGAIYASDPGMRAFRSSYEPRLFHRGMNLARDRFCATRRCNPNANLPELIGDESDATIQAPVWVETPSWAAINAAGPLIARMMMIPGAVRLTCTVTTQGLLEKCRSMAEAPAGLGFAHGAIELSRSFRLSPVLVGQGAAGETVAVRVYFAAPPFPSPPTAPASPKESPATLDLARRLASLQAAYSFSRFEESIRKNVGTPPPGADPAVYADALEAVLVGSKAASAIGEEEMARLYAANYSNAQLAAALKFWATPAAAAFRDMDRMEPVLRAVGSKLSDEALADARARYCRTRPCAVTPAPSAPLPPPSPPAPAP